MSFREIRQRANQVREIPLEAVLPATGAQQDRYDKAKWHTPRGVLSVTGAKFMNWNQGSGGGGAIDLAMHLEGLGFKAAVQWLWNLFPGSLPARDPRGPRKPTLRLPADGSGLRVSVVPAHIGGPADACIVDPIERMIPTPRGKRPSTPVAFRGVLLVRPLVVSFPGCGSGSTDTQELSKLRAPPIRGSRPRQLHKQAPTLKCGGPESDVL